MSKIEKIVSHAHPSRTRVIDMQNGQAQIESDDNRTRKDDLRNFKLRC